jgi:hypothetical protein
VKLGIHDHSVKYKILALNPKAIKVKHEILNFNIYHMISLHMAIINVDTQ